MQENEYTRLYWLTVLERIAKPVLTALSNRELKMVMPVECQTDDRKHVTYLEALGRTLAGIAPWLELVDATSNELLVIEKYGNIARAAIDAATDPTSDDFMNFSDEHGYQPVVDAAFLAHAILRAPNALWEKLDQQVKLNLVAALKQTRKCFVWRTNWLLFAAMVETALYRMGEEPDKMRIDYALQQHEQWYVGDGAYKDGKNFHWDYYNSFVIQPMLVDIVDTLAPDFSFWRAMRDPILKRASRYAAVLERMIAPDGSFVVMGRSMAYRFGAFQHLAQMALQHRLPAECSPAQVRCALTAVIERVTNAPGTFDENGWLKIGLCGSQPSLGEHYISTGSLYLCSTVLLPLGLPPEDDFWSAPPEDWTSKKIWSGVDVKFDKAL